MAKTAAKQKPVAKPVRPPVHILNFGDPGAGKTTFAATFPTPGMVFSFDAYGKDAPFLRLGEEREEPEEMEDGTIAREVFSRETGELLWRIEYYGETDPESPSAYTRYLNAMHYFNKEERKKWATCVVDSVTSMAMCARNQSEYKLNKGAKEPRQHYAYAAKQVEQQLVQRFPNFLMNVIAIAHVSEEKDDVHGYFLRNPSFPGKLRRAAGGQYTEVYRSYYERATKDEPEGYFLQTREGGGFNCMSGMLEAPDPCVASYDAIWENYRG